MSLKNFFTGKTAVRFWLNIVLMVLVIIAVPLVTFYMLDTFTRHGEKIEVPSVSGMPFGEAEKVLKERGLVAAVADSVYDKNAEFGSVIEQLPEAGYEVKGGRVVYLTVAMKEAPMIKLPDVVSLGSLREAVSILQALGFKLTSHEEVEDKPKDLVLGVKLGNREVQVGEMLPRDNTLTLMVGAGEKDSVAVDTFLTDFLIDEAMISEEVESEFDNDIEIEL
ncbi:MAG: PASTA domain-containing protein [Bacteroidaceae bacterium]|nr:PASTA domain-containing protein [Bacteroidaceae bacterium]